MIGCCYSENIVKSCPTTRRCRKIGWSRKVSAKMFISIITGSSNHQSWKVSDSFIQELIPISPIINTSCCSSSPACINYFCSVVFCEIDSFYNIISKKILPASCSDSHYLYIRIYTDNTGSIIHTCSNCSCDMTSMRIISIGERIIISRFIKIIPIQASSQIRSGITYTIYTASHIMHQINMIIIHSNIYYRNNCSRSSGISISRKNIHRFVSMNVCAADSYRTIHILSAIFESS